MADWDWLFFAAGVLTAILAIVRPLIALFRWLTPKVQNMFKRLVGVTALEQNLKDLTDCVKANAKGIGEILAEVKPNSGTSMRDSIDRNEKRQMRLEDRTLAMLHEDPDCIFETDEHGNCTFVNRQFVRVTGRTPNELKGHGWVNTVHPEDKTAVEDEWNRSMTENRAFIMSYRIVTPEGDSIPIKCSSFRMSSGLSVTIKMDDIGNPTAN